MWFKNLVAYRLPQDWSFSASAFEQQLGTRPLTPCGPFDMTCRGWLAPAGSGRLLHTVGEHHLFALGIEQKLLPASIVRYIAAERAVAMAEEQGYPVGRNQMRDLKLRVTEELKARALCRRSMTRAWIDPRAGWLIVDAASSVRAEEVVDTLRDTLGGSFAVSFMETSASPQSLMSKWLVQGEAPGYFSLDEELELQTADETKASVRYLRQEIDLREAQAHLKSGKAPIRLGLTWRDRVSLVLTDKMLIKRVKFLEMSKDASDGDELDAAEQFDIDFAVMTGELARLFTDLSAVMGAEAATPQARVMAA